VVLATPAGAHVDPNVTTAPAGSRTTVEFKIEHGCDGSPTIEVAMQLPPGVLDVVPGEVPGWQAVLANGEIRWTGGSLPAETEGAFGVTLTVPQVAGQKLFFPTVQRCTVGEEAWIDTQSADSENPAPALAVTEALPGTVPPTTAPPPTSASTTTTSLATTTTASTAPADDASGDEADDADEGGGNAMPAALGGAALIAAAAGGGWVALKRRRS
jgi:uncharacterized protein YcnI